MRNRLTPSLIACLLTMVVTTLALHCSTQRTLGIQPLPGTALRVEVVQSRSLSNVLGMGSTEIWFSLVDEKGVTKQTQRLYVIGHDETKWAWWSYPQGTYLMEKDGFQIVTVDLAFDDGYLVSNDVCVGLVPKP